MSHFAVLVIGEDVEGQLAPYHEFECTGINDQYVQDVDVTDECKEHGLDYHGLEDHTVTEESEIDKEGVHKYGYAIVDTDGNLIKAINRTNPNKKWDWYVVGGRWSGWLKLKTGANADQSTKREIDFSAMRNEAGERAAERWDKAAKAHGGQTWEPWSVVGPRTNYDKLAGETYGSQPAVQALRNLLNNPFYGIDEYLTPRDQYIQQHRDNATVAYALVKDGKWIARGEMGWFGVSDDKVNKDDWDSQVNALLDALPDDTQITVVDCHI